MRKVIFILTLFLIFPAKIFALFQPVGGIEDACIQEVVISPLDDKIIFLAAKNALYKSEDKGISFRKMSSFVDEKVRHIFSDAHLANTLYLVTTRRVFKVTDKAERIFSAADEEVILTAAKHKGMVYVGTTQSLYYAGEDILTWRKLKGLKDETAVYSIAAAGEEVFLAASRGIYAFDAVDNVRRVFIIRDSEEEEEEDAGLIPAIIKRDVFDENTLYLGTNQGIYLSANKGSSWQKVYVPGVNGLAVNSITQTPLERDSLYLSTTKGFFKIDLLNRKALQIFEGLYVSEINSAAFTPQGEVYLATAKGLFKNDYFTSIHRQDSLDKILQTEPSIEEIQQVALRYNEVHPDKIRRWRNRLKCRALCPALSLDYDKTITYDSTVDRYYVGPRDWGVGLSWDIGDLVWNTYEDDVDTRGRLNTQIRLDILDEVNRVYFERLRLRQQIRGSSLSEEELFQNKLRLMELSAIIDGYTGGYFSKKLKSLNEKDR